MTDTTLTERLARCVRLRWKGPRGSAGEFWAGTPLGLLYVATERGWGYRNSPDAALVEGGIEAAKAAAQADYTARILAALDMDALAREVEAMVGAAVEADRAEFKCGECDLPSYLCEARCFVRNAIKVHGEEKTWESVKEYSPAIRALEGGKP
jgi:hypothetical protein